VNGNKKGVNRMGDY